MYTAAALLDIHARAQESFRRLIGFCGCLTEGELHRTVPGFGMPTVLEQLEHTIGAEVYWQTVVTRGYTEEATLPPLPDLGAMEAFRAQTAAATRAYLQAADEAELNSAREMISDPGRTRVLRPADVILRIVTHIFNHQGQVLAMCRTMGKPNQSEDVDYPIG
ncbi:MAG TPA: DinB family protein [Vicinamibacterales bacterium]|nr:DinB family protein [Vicinamibacterales bacterium]